MQSPQTSGARRLLSSLLQSAIDDLQKYAQSDQKRARRLLCQAREWVCSDAEHWGSFVFCCHSLGIAPSSLRKRLLDEQQVKDMRLAYLDRSRGNRNDLIRPPALQEEKRGETE